LADSVLVLSRTIERAKKVLGELQQTGVEVYQDFTKAAKKIARKIGETLRKRNDEAQEAGKKAYQELMEMVQKTIFQAQQTREQIVQQTGKTAQRLAQILKTFLPLAERVMDQAQRPIFESEAVSAKEKVVSIYESHTDIIVRGKESHPVEYGHKVWLDEVDGGIVSHYRILDGNPQPYQNNPGSR
jgi:IS5 family transposase